MIDDADLVVVDDVNTVARAVTALAGIRLVGDDDVAHERGGSLLELLLLGSQSEIDHRPTRPSLGQTG